MLHQHFNIFLYPVYPLRFNRSFRDNCLYNSFPKSATGYDKQLKKFEKKKNTSMSQKELESSGGSAQMPSPRFISPHCWEFTKALPVMNTVRDLGDRSVSETLAVQA